MNINSSINGIDVSNWDGKINFSKVRRDGIRIVYIMSTQGSSYVDPDFERNYRDAYREGLAVGFYHYVTARSADEAREEARFFASKIHDKFQHARPAMDFETFGELSVSQIREISRYFLSSLEDRVGHIPVIYSDASNASTTFADDSLRRYPLWIADYGVTRPDMENPWKRWSGWQYTDRGRVRGIYGHVDRNHFRKDILIDERFHQCF